jgi:hypothetical protein
MEIRVHGPGQDPCRSRSRCARRATTSSSRSACAAPRAHRVARRRSRRHRVLPRDPPGAGAEYNVVTVALRRPSLGDLRDRSYLASSSCGICGKAALDEVEVRGARRWGPGPGRRESSCSALPDHARRSRQRVFDQTGGLHAAARFTADGELLRDARRRRPPQRARQARRSRAARAASCRSRRGAARVGPALVRARAEGRGRRDPRAVRGVGAVEPRGRGRRAVRQTVVGFLRDGRFNVYTHPERIDASTDGLEGLGEDQGGGGTRASLWVGLEAERHRRAEAQPLRRDREDDLGEPPEPAVRVAHPAQGRVRRLRARCRRLPRLDDLRRAPLHDPPRPAEGQHHARDRPDAQLADVEHAAERSTARELRELGRLAYPMVRRKGEPGFTRVSWDDALDLIADRIRATTPIGSRSTSPRAASPTRSITSRRRRRASSARTTSTTRRACATRRRPPRSRSRSASPRPRARTAT